MIMAMAHDNVNEISLFDTSKFIYRTQNWSQNFIQHNYEDLYTDIKYMLQKLYKRKEIDKSQWIMSWRFI